MTIRIAVFEYRQSSCITSIPLFPSFVRLFLSVLCETWESAHSDNASFPQFTPSSSRMSVAMPSSPPPPPPQMKIPYHKYIATSSTCAVARKSPTGDIDKLVAGDSTRKQSKSLEKMSVRYLYYFPKMLCLIFPYRAEGNSQVRIVASREHVINHLESGLKVYE